MVLIRRYKRKQKDQPPESRPKSGTVSKEVSEKTKKRKPSGPGAQKPRNQHRRQRLIRENETKPTDPIVEEIPEELFYELMTKWGLEDCYVRGEISQPILHEQPGWSTNLKQVIYDDVPLEKVIERFKEKIGWNPEWFSAYRQGQRHYLALGPIEPQHRKNTNIE